jgi:peptidoglycan/xylan/chitin deacetylase (PgdA/CDA1 family)
MYHGVSPERPRRFRKFVLAPERFEEQMVHLAASGFVGCTVSDLVAGRTRGASDGRRLVGLTFDDAFGELSTYAIPVLQRLAFTATVYVPTAYIGGSSGWLARIGEGGRPLLDADQLRQLSAMGFECGSHSHTHTALDGLPLDAARVEIDQSKKLLEDTLGREVTTFAYPFGYDSAALRRLVAAAGYTSACRVHYTMSPAGEDVFGLSRLVVDGDCGLDRFSALVSGRAALRRERALATLWRPLRRGIGVGRRIARERRR